MTLTTRQATLDDLPQIVSLLMQDAGLRHRRDPRLWPLAQEPEREIENALRFALTAEEQPFRQHWQVAMSKGDLVGVIHSMHLPVPPIYAGKWGDPGLIMPDKYVAPGAPTETAGALVDAAEAALRHAGAELLLAAVTDGDGWVWPLQHRNYEPLTLYFAPVGLHDGEMAEAVDTATEADIEGIVALSAENRATLESLEPFWTRHPDADARFGSWMAKSLTMPDRNMLVSGRPDQLDGYAIAQPASRLHFPPAHDIASIGALDDFYHRDFADPARLKDEGQAAMSLLQSTEAAFTARGVRSWLVVCPAAWASKIAAIRSWHYREAMVWMVKR